MDPGAEHEPREATVSFAVLLSLSFLALVICSWLQLLKGSCARRQGCPWAQTRDSRRVSRTIDLWKAPGPTWASTVPKTMALTPKFYLFRIQSWPSQLRFGGLGPIAWSHWLHSRIGACSRWRASSTTSVVTMLRPCQARSLV